MTQNQVAYKNAVELERHNKMVEQETTRHQQMTEALQRWSNALTNYQIAVNNAHYVRMDAETERANRARETQNLWTLQETQRANVANEAIKNRSNQINAASVAETSRHQKEMERIQSSLNESVIDRNYADVSYTTENTKYVQARTSTEKLQPMVMYADVGLKHSNEALNYEKAESESINRFATYMSGVRQGSDAITGVFKTLIPVVQTSGGSAQPDFWTQMSQMYTK